MILFLFKPSKFESSVDKSHEIVSLNDFEIQDADIFLIDSGELIQEEIVDSNESQDEVRQVQREIEVEIHDDRDNLIEPISNFTSKRRLSNDKCNF